MRVSIALSSGESVTGELAEMTVQHEESSVPVNVDEIEALTFPDLNTTVFPDDAGQIVTDQEQLIAAGYFSWGHDTWIHERSLGTLYTTAEALARVRRKKPQG